MRWFDVNICPLRDVSELAANYEAQNGAIGQFLLAIPSDGESEAAAAEWCREAARHSEQWDVVVGISKRSWAIVPLARELLALDIVRIDRPELAGDEVARREVDARIADITGQLEMELHRAFDGALWYRKHHKPKAYRQAELNSLASELADRRFAQCPLLHNELLNRQKPSASAVSAQNTLLRRMALNEGEARLGIDGFPAEGGLFASILEATALYAQDDSGNLGFRSPCDGEFDRFRLAP
ncbi:MAG TPA: ATP-binding protein, partial [Hyphomonas sp.]|nr:ATP-binding protein [Hyphomonas sp.]